MESVDICAATSRGDNKRRVNKKNRDWHKPLCLRKTAVRPPTMQSEDKHGPKKIAAATWEPSAVWPSSKRKPPEEAQQGSADALRFPCSRCHDDSDYVPKELVRHFEENHRGSPPVFSCHTCAFTSHEFSQLQVHLLTHKDTFSGCGICNDNVQRTWPEFSAHLASRHRQNGKYSCGTCREFSAADVWVFLEHMHAHSLGAEEPSLHTKGKNKFGPKASAPQTLRCQHCGYEAAQKWLITKHVKAVHVCQNGNRGKKKEELNSLAVKPNDTIPKMKSRLTRSAVREMCWLTQDCLSLPGREFLDKYCHLSDPQTTLEETQQFLMKSVARETGDRKWTKALKTVLSNVPQDMNLHPKSENGVVSNASDLTVLTVKNKITVAQNGATYGKRLKMTTSSSDRETAPPESVDRNGPQSHSSDRAPCLQTETKLHRDGSVPAQSEPSQCPQTQENRENQELKSDQEFEEHGKKPEEPTHEDGINKSSELKLTNESEAQTSVQTVAPKRRRRRWKRRGRSRRAFKRASEAALKIVLKKNPVKERQWVSQSSLSPSERGLPEDHHTPLSPHTMLEDAAEESQKKWTKASEIDPSEAVASSPQSKPRGELTPGVAEKPTGSKDLDGNTPSELQTLPEMPDDVEKSPRRSEAEVDERKPACETAAAAETAVEMSSDKLQTSGGSSDRNADGATPRSGDITSSPVPQPVITAEGPVTSDLSLTPSSEPSEPSVEEAGDGGAASDFYPDLLGSTKQEASPASHRRPLLPKHLERTLKLIAINPSQLVKRPAGDQPVVVLNHPDADIPEVARIMEVVNRYRGEVQKVVLSRRTASALSAEDADTNSTRHAAENAVQERFLLKLKLRRLSRKKYEVVDALPPSVAATAAAAATTFRCWFCGRAFACQEAWMLHRQRHLMEWEKPL